MAIPVGGGAPRYLSATGLAAERTFTFHGLSMWVHIIVSANCTIYASLADMEADLNGFLLRSTDPPFSVPLEAKAVFIKPATTSDVRIAYFQRKG